MTTTPKLTIVLILLLCITLSFNNNLTANSLIKENSNPTASNERVEWALVLHGGAGSLPKDLNDQKRAIYESALIEAAQIGSKMLEGGASALDAVEAVVIYLENCPLFNAGKGAVKTLEGVHELDAAIMDGSNLKAGAIAGVKDIKNPIKTARLVMDSTKHVFLIGEGASAFAKSMGQEIVENSYFSTTEREEQYKRVVEQKESSDPRGTVGCVALDKEGNLAAATSTGGMSGKKWGRVGDVPVIGAGTYANNNSIAVSGTGHGEYWIRRVVAYDISALIEYRGLSLTEACNHVIFDKITPMGGSGGGVIAVDREGNLSMTFNTPSMFRAWSKSTGERGVGILKGDEKLINQKN